MQMRFPDEGSRTVFRDNPFGCLYLIKSVLYICYKFLFVDRMMILIHFFLVLAGGQDKAYKSHSYFV